MPIKPYDHTTYPANGVAGSSTALRNELDAIEAGFDLVATTIDDAITGAAGSATTATTKAAEALTSANNADISEAAAAASAAAALVSENAAAASETNAAASALAVANTYDAFDDRYLGSKAVAPTLDNDGNALQAGTLYWDSALVTLRGYNGSAWVNLPATTAASLVNTPAGNLAATDVQGALNELQTDIDTRATAASVTAQIAALVDSSPLALDTLNELAAALADDPNFATTITNALALKAPLASPTLTGTPAGPTAVLGTNTTQLATTAFVKNAVDAIPAVADSSETVKGIVELATDAEAQAFTVNKFIDGAKLNTALKGANQSLAASGYQILAGGLIIQWGVIAAGGTVTITLPLTFPNAMFTAVASFGSAGAAQNPEQVDFVSNSQFTITNYANGSTTKRWIAIGY